MFKNKGYFWNTSISKIVDRIVISVGYHEMEHEARGEFCFFDVINRRRQNIVGHPNDCRDGATHYQSKGSSPVPFAEEHLVVRKADGSK